MQSHSAILKLVGTLRLSASESQHVVRQIMEYGDGSGKRIISQVIQWAGNESPAQIQDESTRFIAVLLKNSHDKTVGTVC